MGLDVHVAHFTVDSRGAPVLLDENREVRIVDEITIHRVRLGRETCSGPDRQLWDCPHNLTLQMMYQSLELLHDLEQYDLFHSFFLYPVGYVTGLLARRKGVPTIATIVGNDVKRYVFSPEKVAVCRSGLENADRVVALSRDLVEMADSLTPMEGKSRIIYNSVRIPEQHGVPERIPGEAQRIGCAGIFKYAKGLPYLFKAVAGFSAGRSVVLELRGHVRDSEQETYRHMVERTGIGHALRLLDPLPHDRVPDWLRTLDVFVLPSLTEGCPNILMEALASGAPSVATRTGAAEELIEDGVSGLLVPWGDSAALGRAMMTLLEDRALAESLGAAARLRMFRFSAEQELRGWKAVYRELLGGWEV